METQQSAPSTTKVWEEREKTKRRKTLIAIIALVTLSLLISAGIAAILISHNITGTITIEAQDNLTVSIDSLNIPVLYRGDSWQSEEFTISNNGETTYYIDWTVTTTGGDTLSFLQGTGFWLYHDYSGTMTKWDESGGSAVAFELAAGESFNAKVDLAILPTASFQSWPFTLTIKAQENIGDA